MSYIHINVKKKKKVQIQSVHVDYKVEYYNVSDEIEDWAKKTVLEHKTESYHWRVLSSLK